MGQLYNWIWTGTFRQSSIPKQTFKEEKKTKLKFNYIDTKIYT